MTDTRVGPLTEVLVTVHETRSQRGSHFTPTTSMIDEESQHHCHGANPSRPCMTYDPVIEDNSSRNKNRENPQTGGDSTPTETPEGSLLKSKGRVFVRQR